MWVRPFLRSFAPVVLAPSPLLGASVREAHCEQASTAVREAHCARGALCAKLTARRLL